MPGIPESRSVSENQKWRIKKLFEQGRATNGNAFGYRMQDGVFQTVPEEAEIVKQIFSDYLSGLGINAIAKKLNRTGIPARYGGLWSEVTVSGILHNEKYTGDLLLQKYYHKDYISKKNIKNRGERPMYYVENDHEPIVSREEFNRVQQELERRMTRFGITREPHGTNLFTGMIRCMLCGKMFRRKTVGTGHKRKVWCCATFNTRGRDACPAQQIPEDILTAETARVLGTADFDRDMLTAQLKEIQVPGHNRLIYVFHDGHTEEVTWQHRSRKESWTEEMKQKAREQTLERAERRKKCRKK